jgi:hypothetical protein
MSDDYRTSSVPLLDSEIVVVHRERDGFDDSLEARQVYGKSPRFLSVHNHSAHVRECPAEEVGTIRIRTPRGFGHTGRDQIHVVLLADNIADVFNIGGKTRIVLVARWNCHEASAIPFWKEACGRRVLFTGSWRAAVITAFVHTKL